MTRPAKAFASVVLLKGHLANEIEQLVPIIMAGARKGKNRFREAVFHRKESVSASTNL